ncbi:hypothetical protein KDM41_04665 [bacterium]|nr:hypothetical protein [bacterium]
MFHRLGHGPLLTRHDVPDVPGVAVDVSSVFNPGALRVGAVSVLMCRVQTRGRRTLTWLATNPDGLGFSFQPRPVTFRGLEGLVDPVDGRPLAVHHVYDARVTATGFGRLVVTALDTDRGCRLAVWSPAGPDDVCCVGLSQLSLVALTGGEDTRNGVLFPGLVGGRVLMLDRPNTARPAGGPPTGAGVRLLASDDLQNWEDLGPVFGGRPHYWDELVGAGPPPVLTEQGWLLIYHGVATHFQAANIYQAGAVLLDRDDPTKVLARTDENLLEPREEWEMVGQVPNVVFPSGLIVDGVADGEPAGPAATLQLYYGAADTCIGRATATVGEVLAACS